MDNQLQTQEPEVLPIVAEQRKEKKLEGRIIFRPGHLVFEYNFKTKTISVAEKKDTEVSVNSEGKETVRHVMRAKEDCIYVQCLNELNAWKRIFQMGIISPKRYLDNVARLKTKKLKT